MQVGLEGDVAAHGLPVAVEGESDDARVTVEDGAAGVAARDVVVREEAELQIALRVGVRAEVAVAYEGEDLGLHVELRARRVLLL